MKGEQQGSSFSEEKEAKRLCLFGAVPARTRTTELRKVFWFFFSKKNPVFADLKGRKSPATLRSGHLHVTPYAAPL